MPKISSLPEVTALVGSDVIPVVRATGTKRNKKIQVHNFSVNQDGYVSVKGFGATGLGSVNDTDTINVANAYLKSLPYGTLYFPDGVYLVTPGGLSSITSSVYGPGAYLRASNTDLSPLLDVDWGAMLPYIAQPASGLSITLGGLLGPNYPTDYNDVTKSYGIGIKFRKGEAAYVNIRDIIGFNQGLLIDLTDNVDGWHLGGFLFELGHVLMNHYAIYLKQGTGSNSIEACDFRIRYFGSNENAIYFNNTGTGGIYGNVFKVSDIEIYSTINPSNGIVFGGANDGGGIAGNRFELTGGNPETSRTGYVINADSQNENTNYFSVTTLDPAATLLKTNLGPQDALLLHDIVTGHIINVSGGFSLGNNGTYSYMDIGTLGHKIYRKTADGSLVLGGGQANIELLNPAYFTPIAASSVTNGCVFVDTADNILKFKDSSGSVHALY